MDVGRRHLFFGIACLGFALLGLPGAILGVAWPAVRGQFALTQADAASVLAIKFGAYFAFSLFTGRMVARFTAAGCLAAACGLMAIGLWGQSAAPSWPAFLAASAFTGAGQGVLDGAVNIVVASAYSQRWLNWLHASFGVGAAAAPQLVTAAADWRQAYLAGALLCLAAVILFAACPPPVSSRGSEARGGVSVLATLRMHAVLLAATAFVAVAGLELTAGQWLFSVFLEARQASPSTAALLVSAYWTAFTASRAAVGAAITRTPPGRILATGMIAVAAASAMLSWPPLFPSAVLVFGAALGPLFALMIGSAQELFGPVHAANAIGILVAASSVGLAVVPGIGGIVASRSLEWIPPFLLLQSLVLMASWRAAVCRRRPAPTPAGRPGIWQASGPASPQNGGA